MNARIKELEALISRANELYYSGTSEITDEQYDAWKDELSQLDANHTLLQQVGAPIDHSHWIKQKHIIPMSSLDKVNSPDQFQKWAQGKSKSGFCVQEKLDGLSLSIDIVDGALVAATTRGDGKIGENILRNVRLMQGVPARVRLPNGAAVMQASVRGEIVLKRSIWQQYFSNISNPRNGASGISRRLDGDGAQHLCFMAYDIITSDFTINSETDKLEILKSLGFGTPSFSFIAKAEDAIIYRAKYISEIRDQLDYDIDGLVFKINDILFQESFGRSSGLATGNPNGQIAFKFANEMRETTIKNITWEVGLTGRITPVAEFEPIQLSGAKIERASLFNFRNVQNLNISVGAKVLVSRRNEVIPFVEKVLEKSGEVSMIPTKCPICTSVLKIDGEYLICQNDNCPAVMQGNIQKWIENIGVDNIGPQLIENMYLNGVVKTIPDLYKLTEEKLAKLDRMGDKSSAKIIKNLNDRKQMPLHILLGSLNIPGCGRRMFESLVDQGYDTLDYIMSLLPVHFEQVDGVGEKTAQDIYNGLRAKKQLIADLLAVGITVGPFVEANSIKTNIPAATGPNTAKGKSFCFTGAMSQPRTVLENFAVSAGAIVKSSVNSSLNYLVMADANSGSTKAVKARKMGVITISEIDFLKMVGR